MTLSITRVFACAAVAFLACGGHARAQDWTRFRGPNGSGISEAKTVPTEWTDGDLNWTVELPGTGHSSPVVWGDKLFITSADQKSGKSLLICIDTSGGKIAWQQDFAFVDQKKNKLNSFASNTPTVDAKHVYVLWQYPKDSILAALDHAGNQVWTYSMGAFKGNHGAAVSPIVYKDMVIVANDQDGKSFIVAIDCASGKEQWRVDRKCKRATYSTPCVFQPTGRDPELIFTETLHGITSIDPIRGTVNWEISPFGTFKQRAIASPVVAGGLVIGSSGFTTGKKNIVAVRPGADGAKATEVYRVSKAVPHIPTPLVYKDWMFMWTDRGGIVTCVESQTGKKVWQKRIGGNFWGSPVCVDGKIYCANDGGTVYVIRAAGEFELLAKNELGHPTHSTPAVSGGVMYFRTHSHVISLGGAK